VPRRVLGDRQEGVQIPLHTSCEKLHSVQLKTRTIIRDRHVFGMEVLDPLILLGLSQFLVNHSGLIEGHSALDWGALYA
jgi:hypothetical protein